MICRVCNTRQDNWIYREVITPELAEGWGLSPEEVSTFNHRESENCRHCGSGLRSRSIAEAILRSFPEAKASSLQQWVEWAKDVKLSIAEINYCGELHKFLSKNSGTKVSQYRESTWRARVANWIKGIKREDITHLSYQSGTFDLVLHSEVLEHINDYKRGLSECRRILKPGGICLFTVPLIMSRKTVKKTRSATPTYHGRREENDLVFWEFGGDLVRDNKLEIALARPQDYMWVLKMGK